MLESSLAGTAHNLPLESAELQASPAVPEALDTSAINRVPDAPGDSAVKIEDFENCLERLKQCVKLLEENKLTLAESLRTYQQASELAEICEQQLAIVDVQMHTIAERLSK